MRENSDTVAIESIPPHTPETSHKFRTVEQNSHSNTTEMVRLLAELCIEMKADRQSRENIQNYRETKNVCTNPGKVHYLSQRFKDNRNKYGGTYDECWAEYLDAYNNIAIDHGLSDDQKFAHLHNLFKGDALEYYNSCIKHEAPNFQTACGMIDAYFNSHSRQMHVRNKLRTVRLSDFTKDEPDDHKALTKLASHISKRHKQTPKSFRTECIKVEYLQFAVQGNSWATPCLARITESTKFQDL